GGILTQDLLRQRGQAIDPLAHVGHAAGKIDADASPWRDHASSNVWTRLRRTLASISLPKRTIRPLRSTTSIMLPNRQGSGVRSPGSRSETTSTDRKPFAFAPPAVSRRNSWRQR